MSSGWEGYVHMMEHKFHKGKKEYTRTNILSSAAIYGRDGTPYAVSANWPGLHTYEAEQETENGTEIVLVNEWSILDQVAGGIRKPGIRIGGKEEKYTFVKFNQEYKSAQLAKQTGGATACKTNKLVLIGIWEKDKLMSNDKN